MFLSGVSTSSSIKKGSIIVSQLCFQIVIIYKIQFLSRERKL